MNSKDYWAKREAEALKHYITDEAEYDRQIKRIYQDMLDSCQTQINDFYGRYAAKEGITLAEAKKRVSQLDIEKYERKAAKYVKDKDFSDKANEEMRLYNLTMKVNRLEMLKANIGLELISGHDEIEKFMAGILKGRTEEELKRQAGILGKTIRNNAKTANAIVNGSFRVSKVGEKSTFSDYIWQYQDLMREDLGKILATGLIQGKNPRAIAKDIRKYWYGSDPKTDGGATYCMERLMRTELARVQTEAQKQSFERNGFDKYIFIVNAGCCGHCEEVADKDSGYGKGVYLVKDMQPGLNAPPIHPNDRCSTAAYEDSEEYEEWLDFLANGGTTAEYNEIKAKGGKVTTPKPKAENKPKTAKKKAAKSTPEPGKLSVDDFPAAFTKGAEKKITQKFVDFVNRIEGSNPDIIKLYKSIGKAESISANGIPFKIAHGKNHAVGYRMKYNGDLVEAKLNIPKLTGDNITGQINTTLHEKMHLLDMYFRTDKKKAGGWFSSSRDNLVKIFKTTDRVASDEILDLFKKTNSDYDKTSKAVRESYEKRIAETKEKYFPNGKSVWEDLDSYKKYEKEVKKLRSEMVEEIDYQCRNAMNGTNNLMDIYDALSGGSFRDNGTVKYGHGSKYYRQTEMRVEETVANYAALSVTRPDLIEVLRKDKPELVAELEATVKAMLKEVGEKQ